MCKQITEVYQNAHKQAIMSILYILNDWQTTEILSLVCDRRRRFIRDMHFKDFFWKEIKTTVVVEFVFRPRINIYKLQSAHKLDI